MEYLMTYGWAILIIAIVLVALFSLGIFNSANFAPRAQPGSCQVIKTSAQTSLAGQCNGMLPEYVADTANGDFKFFISNPQVANGYTVSLWFINNTQSSSCSSTFGIVFSNDFSISTYIPQCYGNGPGSLTIYTQNPSDQNLGQNALTSFASWQNLVMAINFTSNSVKVYRNGNLQFAIDPSSSLGPTSINSISDSGVILSSNIQMYNTTLSSNDIQALYQEGIGGAPINVNNLVGWWPLNGNANDYSGNGNDGTTTNVIYTSAWTSGYSTP
jgi:hypothetical protein